MVWYCSERSDMGWPSNDHLVVRLGHSPQPTLLVAADNIVQQISIFRATEEDINIRLSTPSLPRCLWWSSNHRNQLGCHSLRDVFPAFFLVLVECLRVWGDIIILLAITCDNLFLQPLFSTFSLPALFEWVDRSLVVCTLGPTGLLTGA